MKVVMVCSGNICRSPMAAEYLRARTAQAGLGHVVVESAGTLGIHGMPAPPQAVEACSEIGIDLRGHRSRGLSRHHLRTADLLVGMAHEHVEHCRRLYPGMHASAVLLRSFEHSPEPAPEAPDLDDPIGLPLSAFRESLSLIRTCVDHLVIRLRHAP